MAKLTPDDLVILLLAISTMLLLSRFASELGRKVGLPIVMGELLVGIALGPTVLGALSTHVRPGCSAPVTSSASGGAH